MKLVFEGKGGYKLEQESAKDKLVIGQSYQVEKIQVGRCVTEIYLTNVSGSFNSCLFERDEYLEGLIHGDEESDGSKYSSRSNKQELKLFLYPCK